MKVYIKMDNGQNEQLQRLFWENKVNSKENCNIRYQTAFKNKEQMKYEFNDHWMLKHSHRPKCPIVLNSIFDRNNPQCLPLSLLTDS